MPDAPTWTPAAARALLLRLQDLGVSFLGDAPGPQHHAPDHYSLSVEDLLAWLADRDGAVARRNQVTTEEYHAWIAADGHVRCCARTKAGKRCRGIVPGGGNRTLTEWAERTRVGELCTSHQ